MSLLLDENQIETQMTPNQIIIYIHVYIYKYINIYIKLSKTQKKKNRKKSKDFETLLLITEK